MNPEAYEQMVQSAVELFPTLQLGLDVNVRFDGCKFEFTRQLEIFDIFGVGIYHGWVVDPQDAETAAAIGSTSYNQVRGTPPNKQNNKIQQNSTKSHATLYAH